MNSIRRSAGRALVPRALVFGATTLIALLFTLAIAKTASAGACQNCQTSADCAGVAAGAVCVDWMGNLRSCSNQKVCCPGQGCALTNGVPSCVTSGECQVVGTGGSSGTGGSGGAGGSTGGAGGSTGGAGGSTGGANGSTSDAGAVAPASSDDGGCGCRVASQRDSALYLPLGLGLGLLWGRRWRRGPNVLHHCRPSSASSSRAASGYSSRSRRRERSEK